MDVSRSDAGRDGSIDELSCRASITSGVVSATVSASSDSARLEGAISQVRSVAGRNLSDRNTASFVFLEEVSVDTAYTLSVIYLTVGASGDLASVEVGC